MSKRLTRITTKTGDDGCTSLASMRRVKKNDARIHALGDVDECNSVIGLILSENTLPTALVEILKKIQQHLFWLGADLACEQSSYLLDDSVLYLENNIAQYNQTLAPLDEFILPQGIRAATLCHLARTVCRRAERRLLDLENLPAPILIYMNRLSDLLFILARVINRHNGTDEHQVVFPKI